LSTSSLQKIEKIQNTQTKQITKIN
jgi:hypothetical protein